jgi:hypothetical protein
MPAATAHSERAGACLCHNDAMDDLDALLGDASLTHVTQYSFTRGNETFFIHVHEILTGPKKGRYVAFPHLLRYGSGQFHGEGATGDIALRDCLSKLKDAHFDDIFPSTQGTDQERSR